MKQQQSEEGTWLDKQVSSSFLFILGLLTAPALVLQSHLLLKTGQTLMYLFLARFRRQRLFLPGGLIFLSATILFSLLNPFGRVLFEVSGFHVTEGALRSGLSRGLTVLGLLYLSRFSVRADLRLPGALGMLIAKTFFYLNRLLEARKHISSTSKGWIEKLDRLLETAYHGREETLNRVQSTKQTRWTGFICLLFLLILNWCCVFVTQGGIF